MITQILNILKVTVLAVLFWSCNENLKQENLTLENNLFTENSRSSLLTSELPIEIDSSNYIMFPVIENGAQKERKSYKISKSYSSYYVNMIFQNIKTNETHYLSQKNLKIINFNELRNKNNQPENVILYEVIDEEVNDKSISITSIYLSDNSGKNFTKVSLKNHHLKNWKYLPKTKKIYFNTTVDTNNNKEIDIEDASYLFNVSIENFKSKKILTKELETLNHKL